MPQSGSRREEVQQGDEQAKEQRGFVPREAFAAAPPGGINRHFSEGSDQQQSAIANQPPPGQGFAGGFMPNADAAGHARDDAAAAVTCSRR